MNRKEYFESFEGQVHLWRKRRRRRLHFIFEKTPKGYGRISEREKQDFQETIKVIMARRNRRPYRSNVALKIDIAVDKKNAPSAHKIPKSYIDLLYFGTKTDRRKRPLLISDDSQIKLLTVNYYVAGNDPRIRLTIDRFSHLVSDLQMLYWHEKESEDFENGRCFFDNNFNPEDYRELLSDDAVTAMKYSQAHAKQGDTLEAINFNFQMLKIMMSGYFTRDPLLKEFDRKIYEIQRNQILSFPSCIKLGSPPLKSGDSAKFKQEIETCLTNTLARLRVSVPILHQLGCAIIVIQPDIYIYPDNQKDIDNYAMHYVMPIVHRELSPQTTLENIFHKNYPLANKDASGSSSNKSLPESVIQYQIVEIPRLDSDPKEGCVFMFIGKAEHFNCWWSELDRRIDMVVGKS